MKRAFLLWWKEFWKNDPTLVDSRPIWAAFFGILLATPTMGFCFAAAYHHIWTLKKGLDGPTVNLLIAMLAAGTSSVGIPMLNKSSGPPPGWTPPPIKPTPASPGDK